MKAALAAFADPAAAEAGTDDRPVPAAAARGGRLHPARAGTGRGLDLDARPAGHPPAVVSRVVGARDERERGKKPDPRPHPGHRRGCDAAIGEPPGRLPRSTSASNGLYTRAATLPRDACLELFIDRLKHYQVAVNLCARRRDCRDGCRDDGRARQVPPDRAGGHRPGVAVGQRRLRPRRRAGLSGPGRVGWRPDRVLAWNRDDRHDRAAPWTPARAAVR